MTSRGVFAEVNMAAIPDGELDQFRSSCTVDVGQFDYVAEIKKQKQRDSFFVPGIWGYATVVVIPSPGSE